MLGNLFFFISVIIYASYRFNKQVILRGYLFQVQRYEGASTIYGPYTLPLYIKQFQKLATLLEVN